MICSFNLWTSSWFVAVNQNIDQSMIMEACEHKPSQTFHPSKSKSMEDIFLVLESQVSFMLESSSVVWIHIITTQLPTIPRTELMHCPNLGSVYLINVRKRIPWYTSGAGDCAYDTSHLFNKFSLFVLFHS